MADPSSTNSPFSNQSTTQATTLPQPSQSTITQGLFHIPSTSFKSTGFGVGFGSNISSSEETTRKQSIFGGSSFNIPKDVQASSESNLPIPGGNLPPVNIFGSVTKTSQSDAAQPLPQGIFGYNAPKLANAGNKQSIFGGKSTRSDETSTCMKPSLFGGPPLKCEGVSMADKPNTFGTSALRNEESVAPMKPSVFGGVPLFHEELGTSVKSSSFGGMPLRSEESAKSKVFGGIPAQSEEGSPRHLFGGTLRTSLDSAQQLGKFVGSGKPEGLVQTNHNVFGNKPSIFGGQSSGSSSDFKTVMQFGTVVETQSNPTEQNSQGSKGFHSSLEDSAGSPNMSRSFRIPAVPGGPANTGSNLVSSTASGVFSENMFGKTSTSSHNLPGSSSYLVNPSSKNVLGSSTVSQSHVKTDSTTCAVKDDEKDVLLKGTKQGISADEVLELRRRPIPVAKTSAKTQRAVRKRNVFAKAVQDAAKSSENTEDLRSIYFVLDDTLNDKDMLKTHFSQFGPISRFILNPTKRYCAVYYKNHVDAEAAKRMGGEISGKKVTLFWGNPSKYRRKSQDDPEKREKILKHTSGKEYSLGESKEKLGDELKRSELETRNRNQSVGRPEASRDYGDSLILKEWDSKDTSRKRSQPVPRSEVKDETKTSRSLKTSGLDESVKEELAAMADVGGERTFTAPVLKTARLRRERAEQGVKQVKSRVRKSGKELELDDNTDKAFGRHSSSKVPSVSSKTEDMEENPASNTCDSAIASTDGASELLAIMRQPAHTLEDRLRVLEARDKLIRLRQVKQTDLSKAVKTVGTCPDMCPEKERLLRETRRQISQYEMSKAGQMDPSLMVKQYSRSSADQEEPLPHELRPPAVLTMTMNYLLHCIMDLCEQPGENLAEWYHFLWDRTRGIRKEITQQELCDLDAVRLVEQCARFHIHCCARLVAEDMSVFDDRINTENLTKCLQTLKHMYHDLWIHKSITCPNEPEFITYFLLLNLNNGTIMWELEQLREEVLNNPSIGLAASLYNSLNSNNFVRFFRLVRQASYLNSCLCIRYFYQVRSRALRTYIKAFAKARPVAYPMTSLVKDLGFENVEEAALFCSHYGLHVDYIRTEASSVILSTETVTYPETIPACNRALNLVESKKVQTVGEVVYGGPLPPRTFEGHVPHNSFDADNIMRRNSWSAKDQGAFDSREEDLDLDEEMQALDEVANNKVEKISGTENAQIECLVPQANLPIALASPRSDQSSSTTVTTVQEVGMLFSTTQKSTPSLIFSGSFLPKNTNTGEGFLKMSTSSSSAVFSRLDGGPFSKPVEGPTPPNKLVGWAVRPIAAPAPSFPTQAQLQAEAERKAKEELDKTLNELASKYSEDLVLLVVEESIRQVAKVELEAAEEKDLRKRVLDSQVHRVSNDFLIDLMNTTVNELLQEVASEILKDELAFENQVKRNSLKLFEDLVVEIVREECENIAKKELEKAREEALHERVATYFYHWLSRARRSLHMHHAMLNFPAGVMHLSLKEHAERWGYPVESQLDVWKGRYGRNEKALDTPEFKAPPAFPQTTLAEMIGVIAVHHYDSVRSQLGLYPTDRILFKVVISVPEDHQDRANVTEWWMRRALKQHNSMCFDDKDKGVLRYVSGQKVTSDVVVFASLQLVRGTDVVLKFPSLIAGTSATIFMLSPDSDIEGSRSRLSALLEAVPTLPPPPLVVGIVCPFEPPVEALEQLVIELQLDLWQQKNAIRDYQILHVRECTDLKYITERLKFALSYAAMMWTPVPQLDLVQLRSILKSTFQMFCISIQFNYNSSEIYPQDINDPRVIVGLVNEWLDLMSRELLSTLREASELCAGEFWPLLYKGAYLPFYHSSEYEKELNRVMAEVHIPEVPAVSLDDNVDDWIRLNTKWLKPEDQAKTFKRLSCLDRSLSKQDQMNKIPWMQIIEDWMEARLQYVNTTKLCSRELMVLVCPGRVEELYTNPWWAHSKHIQMYLESHCTGKENDMELDQTVPMNDSLDQTMKSIDADCDTSYEKPSVVDKLEQLQEMASGLSTLKEINSSLTNRMKAALSDDLEKLNSNSVQIASDNALTSETSSKTASLRSIVQNIQTQLQVQRNVNSNVSLMLSDALASDTSSAVRGCPGQTEASGEVLEDYPCQDYSLTTDIKQQESALKNYVGNNDILETSVPNDDILETSVPSPTADICDSQAVTPESGGGLVSGSQHRSRKLDDIMASMNKIVNNLSHKHGLSFSVPADNRIKGLLIGTVPGDRGALAMPFSKLRQSSFVAGSQQRMAAKLQRHSPSQKGSKDKKRSREEIVDYDQSEEVVWDDEIIIASQTITDTSNSSPRGSQQIGNTQYTKRPKRAGTRSPEIVDCSRENSTCTFKNSENSASPVYTENSPSPLSERSFHSDEYVRSPTSEEDHSYEADKHLDDYESTQFKGNTRQDLSDDAEIISSDSSQGSETYSSERGGQSDFDGQIRQQSKFSSSITGQRPSSNNEIEDGDGSSSYHAEVKRHSYREDGVDDGALSGVEIDDAISGIESDGESSYEEEVGVEEGSAYARAEEGSSNTNVDEAEYEETEEEVEDGSIYSESSEEERGTDANRVRRVDDHSRSSLKEDSDECEVILDDD